MINKTSLMLLMLIPPCVWGQGARPENGIRAVTIPSADVTLSFVQPGLVADIHLREGDRVQKDMIVVKLDDTVEDAQVQQLKAESENTTRIDAAEASLAQKRVDLERLKKAASMNAATDLEVQHAVLDVRIADLSLALARFEHEQAVRKYAEGQMRVERMRLISPIDGIVQQVHVEKGESVNALDEVIRLVRIDPLWIDASLPMAQAAQIKAGQSMHVQYARTPDKTVVGKVLHVAPVADAASGTLKARIEVPNPAERPAGEYVWISPLPVTPGM